MKVATATLNRVIERYLRDLAALLPKSSAGRMEECDASSPRTWRSGDERMVKLLELAQHGELLRYCTARQARLLVLAVGGRAFKARKQRVGFVDVPTQGEVRPMTSKEIARSEGLTVRQYEREMTKAREAVSHAISDRVERGKVAA